jgi:hypothetical protein
VSGHDSKSSISGCFSGTDIQNIQNGWFSLVSDPLEFWALGVSHVIALIAMPMGQRHLVLGSLLIVRILLRQLGSYFILDQDGPDEHG